MPLPTSDLRQPVCMEMKTISSNNETYIPYEENFLTVYNNANIPSVVAKEFSNKLREIPKTGPEQGKTNAEHKNDMGSIDSSDTYASCNTHPFLSEGDLTSDFVEQGCDIVDYVLDSNLYINPLDLPSDDGSNVVRGIKKSASGDTALRNLVASSADDVFASYGKAQERGSGGSLNDSPIPKHRKTRFQQGVKSGTKGIETYIRPCKRDSQESLDEKREKYHPRSLVSASRIFNQHLFGIQNLKSGKGKNSESRSSVESIYSKSSPNLEQHRRSKSILKKPDTSHQRFMDPETEKLISDSAFGRSIYMGNERENGADADGLHDPKNSLATSRGTSPPLRHSQKYQIVSSLKGIASKSGTRAHALPVKFVGLTSNDKAKKLMSPLSVFEDIWEGEKTSRDEEATENKFKDRLESVSAEAAGESLYRSQSSQRSPLYICPPPQPTGDEISPNEETKLIVASRSKPLS